MQVSRRVMNTGAVDSLASYIKKKTHKFVPACTHQKLTKSSHNHQIMSPVSFYPPKFERPRFITDCRKLEITAYRS